MLPLPPPSTPVISPENVSGERHSYSPSLLIIAAVLALAIFAIASIHLLLRFLSRSRPNSRSPSSFVQPLPSSLPLSSSSGSSSSSSSSTDQDPKSVIDSLPLFSLSSMAEKPSSSVDCAVCLSPFEPRDQLRLLPSCRHAFHSQCIDTWLRSTLSCPLCRSSILPAAAEAPPPHPPADTAASGASESFRVEIGSVSRRTAGSTDNPAPPPHVRTYSLGSSFEYRVEDDVEAVLARIRRTEKSSVEISGGVAPPGAAVAEMAGGGGSRSWLREYVDRLASSASSSFSSIRWSRRFDNGGGGGGSRGVGVENWDLEGNLHFHLEEEDGGFSSFYRWLVGV